MIDVAHSGWFKAVFGGRLEQRRSQRSGMARSEGFVAHRAWEP